MLDAGYHRTDLVNQVGEVAVRGGVVDVWPPGFDLPLRIDLFGDTVESLRTSRSQPALGRDTWSACASCR